MFSSQNSKKKECTRPSLTSMCREGVHNKSGGCGCRPAKIMLVLFLAWVDPGAELCNCVCLQLWMQLCVPASLAATVCVCNFGCNCVCLKFWLQLCVSKTVAATVATTVCGCNRDCNFVCLQLWLQLCVSANVASTVCVYNCGCNCGYNCGCNCVCLQL